MINKLPEWYRIASLTSINITILESRSKVIASIIENKDIKWIFNCIRLYLNKPIINQEFKAELIKLFLDDDPLFQQKDNDLELRVLSGAILNEYIINNDSIDGINVALALITCSFDEKNIINQDIIEDSIEYLRLKSISLRETDSVEDIIEEEEEDDDDENEEEEEEEDDDENPITIEELNNRLIDIENKLLPKKRVISIINLLNNKISNLEEESNIHWWIFRSISNFKNQPMKDLESTIAPLILGLDLSNLTSIVPGSVASEQFLRKVLFDNIPNLKNPIVLKEAINKIEKTDKIKIVEGYQKTELGNLCPIMYGLFKASEIDDESSWLMFFEKHTLVKSNATIDVVRLSYQFYLENLLIKCLE